MNVFVLGSATTVLNALEAQQALGLPPSQCDLVVVGFMGRASLDQTEKLISEEDWNSIRIVTGTSRLRHLRWLQVFWRLTAIARGYGRVEKLFIAEYLSTLMRHFANVTDCESVWSLDDGSETWCVAAMRRRVGADRAPGMSRLSLLARRLLFGLRYERIEALNYFTVYPVSGGPGEKVVRNTYERLKDLAGETCVSEESYLLGSPYVKVGVVRNMATYMGYLRGIQRHLANTALVYVPHRFESPGSIELIRQELGMKIRRFDLPIEYVLCAGPTVPGCVVSFTSSALVNLLEIFASKMKILAFEFRGEDIAPSFRQVCAEYYTYLRSLKSKGLEVVESAPE